VSIRKASKDLGCTLNMDTTESGFFLLSLPIFALIALGVCLDPSFRGSPYFFESLYTPGR
jgi:hypothetical protein